MTLWVVLRALGGPGLLALGIISSLVPLPGSQDALLIVLAAHSRYWVYYAAMATVGSVAGGYLNFRVGKHGGNNRLARRFIPARFKGENNTFNEFGFHAVLVAALLPPPLPTAPVLMAAGASKYCVRKFLAALTVGRGIRFGVAAYLSAQYGRRFFLHIPISYSVALVMLLAAWFGWLIMYKRMARSRETGTITTLGIPPANSHRW